MKLTIYGRETCPFCVKAKELANRLKADSYIEDFEYVDYQKLGISVPELSKIAKVEIKTVPVVLLNDVYIGGFTDLKAKFGY